MRAAWGVLFLSLVVNTSSCLAQTVGASLQGTVYDPSGGFVPGAAIEIRNAEQGAVRALITDDKGRTAPCPARSEEHTSELQSQSNLVCRLLLEKKNTIHTSL